MMIDPRNPKALKTSELIICMTDISAQVTSLKTLEELGPVILALAAELDRRVPIPEEG